MLGFLNRGNLPGKVHKRSEKKSEEEVVNEAELGFGLIAFYDEVYEEMECLGCDNRVDGPDVESIPSRKLGR